jgi:hypothetical protein
MKIKPSSYFLVILAVAMMVVIFSSLRMPYYESRLLPLIVASITLLLVALELWNELHSKDGAQEVKKEERPESKRMAGSLGTAVGWILGATLGVYLLGFVVGIVLFVLSYLKMRGRGWKVSLAASLITTALIYGIFEIGLKFELYKGLIYTRFLTG